MSAHERHAELIAELRQLANAHREHIRPDGYGGYETVELGPNKKLLALAGCLEAAHKREVQDALDTGGYVEASRRAKQSGNVAKLREALCFLIENEHTLFWADLSNGELELLQQIVGKARAALASPARNCDKHATADEALKAQEQMFNDSNFANGECKLGCPECDNPRVGCKIAWLFAPATEQKGEGDGNK